jgi:hypothetical protein
MPRPRNAGIRAASAARYLAKPSIVMDRIWALPDRSLHALGDGENSSPGGASRIAQGLCAIPVAAAEAAI